MATLNNNNSDNNNNNNPDPNSNSGSLIPREYYPYMVILCKLKKKRLVESYYEVHITPNDPTADRIPPVVVKAERQPPEICEGPEDPNYLYRLCQSYVQARKIYKSMVWRAVETRNRLIREYQGRNCVVTLVPKRQ